MNKHPFKIGKLNKGFSISEQVLWDRNKKPKIKNWYQTIESEVRDLVKLLRNNGWNTTCSCGHEMIIQIDIQNMDEMEKLGTFLIENGIKEFDIRGYLNNIGGGFWKRWVELSLKKK